MLLSEELGRSSGYLWSERKICACFVSNWGHLPGAAGQAAGGPSREKLAVGVILQEVPDFFEYKNLSAFSGELAIVEGQHVPTSKTLAPQDLQDFAGDFRGATQINATTSLGPAAPCSISSWKGGNSRRRQGRGDVLRKRGFKKLEIKQFPCLHKEIKHAVIFKYFEHTSSSPSMWHG